jgi:hypothetical protein
MSAKNATPKIRQERSGGAIAEAVRRESTIAVTDRRAVATASAPLAVTGPHKLRGRRRRRPNGLLDKVGHRVRLTQLIPCSPLNLDVPLLNHFIGEVKDRG